MYSHRRWCAAVPVLSALSALVVMAHAATIKFDQSQTGDYNLQIHLKNIELYAVFDDSGGSDDEYEDLPDYTDVTNPNENTSSKPPSPQPPAAGTPSTTTSAPPSTAAIASTTPQQSTQSPAGQLDPYSTSDKIVQMVEALIASNGNTSDMPTEPPSTVTVVATSPSAAYAAPSTAAAAAAPVPLVAQSPAAAATASASTSATGGGTANRKCGPGYFRDPMGRCRRIRKPHLPFLQMVHTPGVIKSFQPQQRTAEEDSVAKN